MVQHIFISHAWKYTEHYKKIVQWLDEAQAEGQLTWSNYSVPAHDPKIDPKTTVGKNKLKEELKKQKLNHLQIFYMGMLIKKKNKKKNIEVNF